MCKMGIIFSDCWSWSFEKWPASWCKYCQRSKIAIQINHDWSTQLDSNTVSCWIDPRSRGTSTENGHNVRSHSMNRLAKAYTCASFCSMNKCDSFSRLPLVSTVIYVIFARFGVWIPRKRAKVLIKPRNPVQKGTCLHMCDSQSFTSIPDRKHMQFIHREDHDKSQINLFLAWNTAFHDFLGDFRGIYRAWLAGTSKHLDEVSM